MVTRTKTAAKTPVQQAAQTATGPVPADKPIIDSTVEEAQRIYREAQAKLLDAIKLPSGTRLLVSTVVGILSYASAVWFVAPVIDVIVMSATAFTGSVFIGYLLAVLAWFLAGFAAAYLGYKAFSTAMSFDTGKAMAMAAEMRDASKRRVSQVRGWFARGAKSEDAEIIGAC